MYSVPPTHFLYSSYKVTARHQDEIGNTHSGIGTAFVVAAGDRFAIVTNRHVLDLVYGKSSAHPSTRMTSLRLLGKGRQDDTFELEFVPTQPILVAPSRVDDVACIVNPRIVSGSPKADIFHHFGFDALADENFFSECLYPGEQIFFAGFPNQYDKLAERPILRSGTIASDPQRAYSVTGKDEGARLAYEGFSSEGASGSAVWAAARSFRDYPGARTGALIGINSGHIPEKHGNHSGISYFYKSTVLIELLSQHGFRRSAA